MTKHSILIRNKEVVIYYHKGGEEHKILGGKKRGTQKIFLLKGENRRFSQKDFLGFIPCISLSLELKSAQNPSS